MSEPRKPVAGWRSAEPAGWVLRSPIGDAWAYASGLWSVPGQMRHTGTASLESAQLAAEDALFAIADAINALRKP